MTKNEDVVDVIKSKNREIYIKKLGIDLDKILEGILITTTNTITLFYVEINQILNLDEKDKEKKNSPIKDIRSFCKTLKCEIEKTLNNSFKRMSECVLSIEKIDYNDVLVRERTIVLNEIETFYNEEIDDLISVILGKNQKLDKKRLDYYFKNYLFEKFMLKIKENLINSFQIILNSQQEGLERYENLNNKTVNNIVKSK